MPIVLKLLLEVAVWTYLLITTTNASYSNAQFCDKYYKHNRIRPQISEGEEQDSNIDLVRKQYLSFPYPYVSQQYIQMEQKYYQSPKRNIPITTYPSIALEMVNHYLYQGENGFK